MQNLAGKVPSGGGGGGALPALALLGGWGYTGETAALPTVASSLPLPRSPLLWNIYLLIHPSLTH